MISRRLRVLFVDDDPSVRRAVARTLRVHFVVDAVGDATAVEAAVRAARYDGFITDLEMPDVGGFELIRRVGAIDARLAQRAVILTGAPFTKEQLDDLVTKGYLVVLKGAPIRDIVDAVLLRIRQHP